MSFLQRTSVGLVMCLLVVPMSVSALPLLAENEGWGPCQILQPIPDPPPVPPVWEAVPGYYDDDAGCGLNPIVIPLARSKHVHQPTCQEGLEVGLYCIVLDLWGIPDCKEARTFGGCYIEWVAFADAEMWVGTTSGSLEGSFAGQSDSCSWDAPRTGCLAPPLLQRDFVPVQFGTTTGAICNASPLSARVDAILVTTGIEGDAAIASGAMCFTFDWESGDLPVWS